jgi:hypothetical protein
LLAACSSFHVGAALARGFARVIHAEAALVHFGQAVMQRVDQFLAALRVVQQVILQIGIAAHRPDIAQHFVQHARRPAGLARAAQRIQARRSSPSSRITISRSENDV